MVCCDYCSSVPATLYYWSVFMHKIYSNYYVRGCGEGVFHRVCPLPSLGTRLVWLVSFRGAEFRVKSEKALNSLTFRDSNLYSARAQHCADDDVINTRSRSYSISLITEPLTQILGGLEEYMSQRCHQLDESSCAYTIFLAMPLNHLTTQCTYSWV